MVEVRELTAGYGRHTVLKGVTFSLEKGRILGLLGRNGCGKTTLFKCLNGFLKPASGSIRLAGRDISALSRREHARVAALVPQAVSAVFSLPVKEMMLLGAGCRVKAWQAPGESYEEEALGYAGEMGIAHLAHKQFNEISGGEQQLVLIARALMQNADILLLDEPTSHLDFTNKYKIMDMVKRLTDSRHITTIITAHDPNLVIDYCTDVLMLSEGRVMAYGPAEAVMTEDALGRLYGERISLVDTALGRTAMRRKDGTQT